MSTNIEKEFSKKLTKKDYFLYLINRNIFILISPLIIMSLFVVFIFMIKKDGFQTNDILYLLPTLLFLLSYIQIYRAINNAVKLNANTKTLKIILEEKKYKEITDRGENSLEYSKFYSYYENKNYYYLYVDKINALILPKREFNEDELKKLNDLFKNTIRKTSVLNFKTILGLIFSLSLIVSMIILIISII